MQAEGPRLTLYVPLEQGKHVPPFSPVKPAWHWQLPMVLLASGEVENIGQSTHVSATVYLPAAQTEHAWSPTSALT